MLILQKLQIYLVKHYINSADELNKNQFGFYIKPDPDVNYTGNIVEYMTYRDRYNFIRLVYYENRVNYINYYIYRYKRHIKSISLVLLYDYKTHNFTVKNNKFHFNELLTVQDENIYYDTSIKQLKKIDETNREHKITKCYDKLYRLLAIDIIKKDHRQSIWLKYNEGKLYLIIIYRNNKYEYYLKK